MDKNKEEAKAKQRTINSEWETFSKTHAYKDLVMYMDDMMSMYLQYAEEMQMPSPLPGGGKLPIDKDHAFSYLQNRRGVNIVKTYIRLRSEKM